MAIAMTNIVRIVGTANGGSTPHDGCYVVAWNPHTKFGTCEIDTTRDLTKARRFKNPAQILDEWTTVSVVQRKRPDGKPNRPLSGLTIEITKEPLP